MRYHVSPDLIELRRDNSQILADGCVFRPVLIRDSEFDLTRFVENLNSSEPQPHPVKKRGRDDFSGISGHDLAQVLLEAGIVHDTINTPASTEANKKEIIRRSSTDKFQNFTLYLLVTQYCNLKCVYCYNGDETYARDQKLKMSFETAQKAIRFFWDKLEDQGNLSIVFFGGEPLLNWPVIKQTLDWADTSLEFKGGKAFASI